MNNETFIAKEWNDVIFENRNKDYGAYALRKSYDERVIEGSLSSIGIVIFIFCIPAIISWFNPAKMETDIHDIICHLPISLQKIDFAIKKAIPKPHQPSPKSKANLALVPTKDSVETNIPVAAVELPSGDVGPGTIGTPSDVDGQVGGDPGSSGNSGVVIEENKTVDFAEFPPEFDGGLKAMSKFIQKELKYPSSAKRIGTEGKVFVRFVVSKNGSVTDVEVIKGISNICDAEAARVISLMKGWKPGRQNHSPVNVRMVLPINFRLTQ